MVEFKTISYEDADGRRGIHVRRLSHQAGGRRNVRLSRWTTITRGISKTLPFGGKIAHPVLLGNQALLMRHSKYIVPAGLHAKMQFEFVEPLRVGCACARTAK